MVKTLLPLVALVLLLVGCATPGSLTKDEEWILERVDPKATRITRISDFVFDVSNPTLPSGYDTIEKLEPLLGKDRVYELGVLKTVSERYKSILQIYNEASLVDICQKLDRWPDRGLSVASHTRRFTCLTPIEWVRWKSNYQVESCSRYLSPPDPLFQRAFYTFPTLHPCDFSHTLRPPSNFCDLYSKTIGHEPTLKISCSGLTDLVERVKFQEQLQSSAPPTTPNISIDDSKAKCSELGFKAGTEKFGDCVLKLSK